MTKYYYGCDEVLRGWSRYYNQCNALELDLNAEKNSPTIATLNRWRVDSPRGFGFMLHVDQEVPSALAKASDRGNQRLPKHIDASLDSTLEKAQALAAKALFLQTPMEVTPGETSRALLTALVERVNEKGNTRPILWEPSGLWERGATREFADQAGLVMAFDPFMAMRDGEPCGHGDVCFVVSERAGMRRKFDQFDFEDLLVWSSAAQRVFITLRGRFKAQHAKEMQHLFKES